MVFFFVPILTLVIVAVAFFVIAQDRAAGQAWSSAARWLSLAFEPGGLFSSKRMHGHIRRHTISVDTFTEGAANSAQQYTRYRLGFDKPLPVKLRLTREGLVSKLSHAFGAHDIRTGDAHFDGSIQVEGEDRRRVQQYLTSERRVRVHELLRGYDRAVIDERGIEVASRGFERDPEKLAFVVRRLVDVAAQLTGVEEAEPSMGSAKAEDSLAAAEPVPPAAVSAFEVDAAVDAITTLQATTGEAVAVHEPDPSAAGDGAGGEGGEGGADDTRAATIEPVPDPSAAAPTDELTISTVCEALFGSQATNLDAARSFEQSFRDRHVRWTGRLDGVDASSFDLAFGFEPLTRARVAIHSVDTGLLGQRDVHAIVQLPPDALGRLAPLQGQTVSFEGRLVKCDFQNHSLFVADGHVVVES